MLWEKKICIRLTKRRILGAILTAATVLNLVVVGAAFETTLVSVAPTLTLTSTSPPIAIMPFVPTLTEEVTSTLALLATNPPTQTSSVIPTHTSTTTSTQTVPPTWTPCAPRYAWPVYTVQPGDTLSTLARLTGSTSGELMQANCLTNDLILVGQLLYVPRAPIKILTPTPSSTSTIAPPPPITVTPSTITDTPPTPVYTPPTPDGPVLNYFQHGP